MEQDFLIYDTQEAKSFEGIFDIATPQECADLFDKNVLIETKLFEELERILTIQNEYSQKTPHNKEQKAYLQGLISALEIITNYNYTFNKESNKINKIFYPKEK
jgi:hypothetical protein